MAPWPPLNTPLAIPLSKNFFRKSFVQYGTVWLVQIWTSKNADEKEHILFQGEEKMHKNGQKTDTA